MGLILGSGYFPIKPAQLVTDLAFNGSQIFAHWIISPPTKIVPTLTLIGAGGLASPTPRDENFLREERGWLGRSVLCLLR